MEHTSNSYSKIFLKQKDTDETETKQRRNMEEESVSESITRRDAKGNLT